MKSHVLHFVSTINKHQRKPKGHHEWTIQKHCQHWTHKTKDNTETLSTLDTQDIGQYRDTGNIGRTRHRTIQKHCQHWTHKTQDNTETLSTLDTQDIGRRQSKQEHNTTQKTKKMSNINIARNIKIDKNNIIPGK